MAPVARSKCRWVKRTTSISSGAIPSAARRRSRSGRETSKPRSCESTSGSNRAVTMARSSIGWGVSLGAGQRLADQVAIRFFTAVLLWPTVGRIGAPAEVGHGLFVAARLGPPRAAGVLEADLPRTAVRHDRFAGPHVAHRGSERGVLAGRAGAGATRPATA